MLTLIAIAFIGNLYFGPAHVVLAQFPTDCVQNLTTNGNVNSGPTNETFIICCPNNCGADQGRGECVKTPNPLYSIEQIKAEDKVHLCDKSDFRLLWPSRFNWTHTCRCKSSWAGPDCSKCAFGYTLTKISNRTQTCVKSSNLVKRKSTLRLTDAEWETYTNTLLRASVEPSNYSVLIGTFADSSSWKFVPVTVYDYLIWVHYFASKDNNDETPTCDFAHESSGFLTWHRWYLLVAENMLREINSAFFLPYWDWTNEASAPDLFSEPHLGSATTWDDIKNRYPNATDVDRCGIDDPEMNVKNGPFRNWKTMCTNLKEDAKNGFLCNPNNETQKNSLKRCLGCCQVDNCCHDVNSNLTDSGREASILPKKSHVDFALEATIFDTANWTTATTSESFRNRLEGFVQPIPPYAANHDQHYLHNQVHIYVGGVEVPLAPTSPYFWTHHGMIDYVFEQWLEKNPGAVYMPTVDKARDKLIAHPGHNPEENIVPFFPTVTHVEVFKRASSFGYMYESPTGLACVHLPVTSVVLFFSLLAFGFSK